MPVFLADESFPDPTVELIESLEFQVKKARKEGLSGFTNPQLFAHAQANGWVLLTADKGLGDVRIYPPSMHVGVIVLRVWPLDARERMQRIHHVLKTLLAETADNEYPGVLFVVDRNKYRKRRRP